jgi:hypothetical protein
MGEIHEGFKLELVEAGLLGRLDPGLQSIALPVL